MQPPVFFPKNDAPAMPQVSSRTFAHCLNALWVNTEILRSNAADFSRRLPPDFKNEQQWLEKLARFQCDLAAQSEGLELEIWQSGSHTAPLEKWDGYAENWSIRSGDDLPAARRALQNGAGFLADLYENALVLALQRDDREHALYLFAHHLAVLTAFLNDSPTPPRRRIFEKRQTAKWLFEKNAWLAPSPKSLQNRPEPSRRVWRTI